MTANQAPFLAEVELCGSTFIADHHWHCINEPPLDDSWLLPSFEEGPEWKPATRARCLNGCTGGMLDQSNVSKEACTLAVSFFSKDGNKFIQPSSRLDDEAEEAWRMWKHAKEEANQAWLAWRKAKEQQQKQEEEERLRSSHGSKNGTTPVVDATADATTAGGPSSSVTSTMRATTSDDKKEYTTATMAETTATAWKANNKDTMNQEEGNTLQWAKPRPKNVHGYYCRLVVPNPLLAEGGLKGGRGVAAGTSMKK